SAPFLTDASASRSYRRLPCRPASSFRQPLDRLARQLVAAVVPFVIAMSLHLHVSDVMDLHQVPERLPQILVLDRLPLAVAPAVLEPAAQPILPEAVHDISRVAVHFHDAWLLEQPERFDYGRNLHPILRRH